MKVSKGIDFLKASQQEDLSKTKFFRSLKVGSLVLLIFYCLFIGAVFSYWLYLQKSGQKISNQYSQQKQKIIDLQEIESKQIVLKQRLASLNKLFSQKRTDYSQVLSSVDEISISGISFTKIEISPEGNLLLAGTAENASIFSLFLEKFLTFYSQQEDAEIVLSSLGRGKDGQYRFSLLLKNYEKS